MMQLKMKYKLKLIHQQPDGQELSQRAVYMNVKLDMSTVCNKEVDKDANRMIVANPNYGIQGSILPKNDCIFT